MMFLSNTDVFERIATVCCAGRCAVRYVSAWLPSFNRDTAHLCVLLDLTRHSFHLDVCAQVSRKQTHCI